MTKREGPREGELREAKPPSVAHEFPSREKRLGPRQHCIPCMDYEQSLFPFRDSNEHGDVRVMTRSCSERLITRAHVTRVACVFILVDYPTGRRRECSS